MSHVWMSHLRMSPNKYTAGVWGYIKWVLSWLLRIHNICDLSKVSLILIWYSKLRSQPTFESFYLPVWHTATLCNTLQHTVTHCNSMQHTASWLSRVSTCQSDTLKHTATHCNTLQHTATHTLQLHATHCNTLQPDIREFLLASLSCVGAHCKTLQNTATTLQQHCNMLSTVSTCQSELYGLLRFVLCMYVCTRMYVHTHVLVMCVLQICAVYLCLHVCVCVCVWS